MFSPLLNFVLRGLTVTRWSNFPRIERPNSLDHITFSLHVAYLLADLVEEATEARYDRIDIFKRALFSLLFTSAYSDINSDVKSRLKREHSEIYAELCKNMHSGVLSWKLGGGVGEEFEAFVNTLESGAPAPKEQAILSYGKYVSAYYEAEFNGRIYPEVYAGPLTTIRLRLAEPRFAEFRKHIDVTKDSGAIRFLLSVRRLQSALRWNRLKRAYPVSVMSHLFVVTVISFILFRSEKRSDAEVTESILRSLYHDVPETITGDIITPTKKATPGLEDVIRDIEEKLVEEQLLNHIRGHAFEKSYRDRLLDPWGDDLGKLVKQADHLSAFLEARIEELDNPFGEQFKKSRESITKSISKSAFEAPKRLREDFELGIQTHLPDFSISERI
jgi:putative hydrolase of HD superfamily